MKAATEKVKPAAKVTAKTSFNGAAPGLASIRERLEAREEAWLDVRAAKSGHSKGRERSEGKDPFRTEFQRDRDRIIHTKAFRRLKHKTQVFVSPEQDHYRTRLTHTLEVTQISRTVARALCLNEDLTEAIGMGHDLGHAPFGHVGEEALDTAYRRFDPEARFRHYEHSLRIVDKLERDGQGLNLTWEVRDGILHHSKGKSDLLAGEGLDKWLQKGKPSTLEGQIIRICDRVAYVNHDVDDAIRAGLIKQSDLPKSAIKVLGKRHSERITKMVTAIIEASSDQNTRAVRDRIAMRDDVMEATDALKNWMFDHVYKLDSVDETPRVATIIDALFACFMEHPHLMRRTYGALATNESAARASSDDALFANLTREELARVVCDYVAGMTDRYASLIYTRLFLPSSWRGV